MLNLSKGIIAILLAAALSWSSTAIAHPSQASGSSHHSHNTSSSACAYSCSQAGHGSSAFDEHSHGGSPCGECSCWG